MNIEPKSRLYWILHNIAPGAWNYPSNFCQLCRQLLGVTVIGALLAIAASFELFTMTFFVLEVFNGSVTTIVEGEEVVRLWLSGYLGIGEGFGTTVFIFGILGWMAVSIITFVITCAVIGESTWYNNMTQGYSNWRWAWAEDRSERRAARVPRTSGFWYLVGVYVDSVHKKICPLITYDKTEKTTT